MTNQPYKPGKWMYLSMFAVFLICGLLAWLKPVRKTDDSKALVRVGLSTRIVSAEVVGGKGNIPGVTLHVDNPDIRYSLHYQTIEAKTWDSIFKNPGSDTLFIYTEDRAISRFIDSNYWIVDTTHG